MRVYLDACCLSRLTDDPSQPRIRAESMAIEFFFTEVQRGNVTMVSSETLHDEVGRNPSAFRRLETLTLLSLADVFVKTDRLILKRARSLVAAGYAVFDSLHLASAESAQVQAMLTTDDRFLRRAARDMGQPRVRVMNPVSWKQEFGQ